MLLAAGSGTPDGLAQDGANLYWTDFDQGTISAVDKLGGFSTVLASAECKPHGIATDGMTTYWTCLVGGTLSSTPSSGGPTNVLATIAPNSRRLTVNKDDLYWTSFGATDGSVWKMSKAPGSLPVLLAGNRKTPWGIVADDAAVYWSESFHLMRLDLAGGEPTILYLLNDGVDDIAADSANIYGYGHGNIMKFSKTGGDAVILAADVEAYAMMGIAVDDENVYWVEMNQGDVHRVPKNGGEVALIASGQPGPRQIVVDESAVYWTNGGSPDAQGAVMRLAK
ncbi:MAG: hypothetical protein IPM35_26420 [Myxococcales bacterium]|nr:hypothetical protein [Myxococcales bacterium]